MESGYVLALERVYSLDELKDIARAKGMSPIGTKRDIAARVLKIELPIYPSTKQKYHSEEIFNRAKHYFGVTTNPKTAGYILPDGTMLDFSGESFSQMGTRFPRWLYSKRELDHREISFAWPDSDAVGGHEGMRQFMNWGVVRFSLLSNTVIVNVTRRLTHSQISVIDYVLRNYPSYTLVIEISDQQLSEMASKDFLYPFTGWASYVNNHIDSKWTTVDYWNKHLEYNQLRSPSHGKGPDTDAGAFLAWMLEAAGDIIRELAKGNFADTVYIYEKYNRLKNNIKSRDWTDPLSEREKKALEKIQRDIYDMPVDNDLMAVVKIILIAISERKPERIELDLLRFKKLRGQQEQSYVAQVKKTAFQYGKEARVKGLKAAAQDKEFLEAYAKKGAPVGDPSFLAAVKEWSRGWQTEHKLVTDRELYDKQWQWGAEPMAAIPGEPIEFYKADKYFDKAEAFVVEVDTGTEDSKYYIMKKDRTYVRNPKTNTALFDTVDDAKDAHFKELQGGR